MLFAARSAAALHRLLDVAPVFRGDARIRRRFVLVPGSVFDVDALAALAAVERAGARTVPWSEARAGRHDLVLAASPKGELSALGGPLVLLPHGAGYNKALPQEGTADSASGLDGLFLLPEGRPLADVHALAHPGQIERLAADAPAAAGRGVVVGDPTLDRILESAGRRDRYRAALGTGTRRLVVVVSTWGPESLAERRPGLVRELAAHLPYDEWQVALVLHPNTHSEHGTYDLRESLAPELDAGLVLSRPYEEWGALLVAADAVVTDHGSTALYAAALDQPVVAACDGGAELIPGSPMAELLGRAGVLGGAADLDALVAGHRPGELRATAATAFARQGEALELLRTEVYRLLGLAPPPYPADPAPLPVPEGAARTPYAFAVDVRHEGTAVRITRHPAWADVEIHHLAADAELAARRHQESAALLFRRSAPDGGETAEEWTAEEWTARVLERCPGSRTVAAPLAETGRWLIRRADGALYDLRLESDSAVDPTALLSGVHDRLSATSSTGRRTGTALVDVLVGGTRHAVRLTPRTGDR
ncbi:translation initiation factor 2 [Streptomyces sp. P9(2023)]|uniref:translation initiation factor 2 n=1 Tax=Streptomyces sp. P9(2023) TaxID=3064394 RepID=UPI0028F413B4|nr:translation initiation factor 2 [Streptomyces sp. P9(2023)]MDT9687787.1 translation initiation factor 2 [Streptomyces sp. P9(2023)]